MSTPRVSILLPVLNAEATIQGTLHSLFNQEYRDFEVLVIDDGSRDNTPAILEAEEDPRLRVLRNPERLKLSGALNRGLEEARGEFIARMDADDLARPTRLLLQVSFMDRHPEIMLCGSATQHFGDRISKTERYPAKPEAIRAFSLFNCPFAHPTVLFRRKAFLEAGLRYDGSFYPSEDYELWARMVHQFPCANLQDVLLDYRVHGQSMTGSDWSNMDEQSCRLMGEQFQRLGIELTETRLKLNRDIGMARVPGHRLQEALEHLQDLLRRNEEREFCPSQALLAQIRERWFHVCMNASGASAPKTKLFLDKALWGTERPPLWQQGLMLLSELRQRCGF